MVNFRVTVNKCLTELIRGFIIHATQVCTCTTHAHMHTLQIFACVIFVDTLHREKRESYPRKKYPFTLYLLQVNEKFAKWRYRDGVKMKGDV